MIVKFKLNPKLVGSKLVVKCFDGVHILPNMAIKMVALLSVKNFAITLGPLLNRKCINNYYHSKGFWITPWNDLMSVT